MDQFKIDLKGMQEDNLHFSYTLSDDYFAKIDGDEVQRGNLVAEVDVQKKMQAFELTFRCDGKIIIPCDRCLDDMNLDVHTEDSIIVKLGDEDGVDGDVIIVSEADGYINIAWLLYEFISLAIPIKHVHPYGQCNKDMARRLKAHMAVEADDEEGDIFGLDESDDDTDRPTDPRWDELKKILDNN